MGNWRTLVVLGFAVIAAAMVGLMRRGDLPSLGGSHTVTGEAVVTLTEEGYEPKTLTVVKAATVTFQTTRSDPFWPASDLHPTHDIYPEFDPREPVAADKTWSFRFDKVGTWRYHDHLFPYYRGTITVVDR